MLDVCCDVVMCGVLDVCCDVVMCGVLDVCCDVVVCDVCWARALLMRKVYSQFQNGWPKWQMSEQPNGVTSLLVLLLVITSHLLSSTASCYDVMPFAICLLANHSEIGCTNAH